MRLSQSRPLASFRCHLSRSAWFLAGYGSSLLLFLLFSCGFDWRQRFRLGLFCRAMMAMPQGLDARRFLLRSELSVGSFLPLLLKVFCNCLSCHGCSVAETVLSNLCCFGHSVTIPGHHEGCHCESG